MEKAGLIGLGMITRRYVQGLAASSVLKLTAVCDLKENPASLPYFESYPRYRDYREMIAREQLSYVIISTPPATHLEIARYALEQGVNVIVEKPAVLNMQDYDSLLRLAEKKGLLFEVAFHWQNGSEVRRFSELYDPARISQIRVQVQDPYCADGERIDAVQVVKEGAWVDSGVNILSMLRMWLPFERIEKKEVTVIPCKKTGLPVYANVTLVIDGIPVDICIDWRMHQDNKCSWVIYEGRKIVINHSAQQIEDGEQVIPCRTMERMDQHYYTYFSRFGGTAQTEAARDVHRILLEVKTWYEETNR